MQTDCKRHLTAQRRQYEGEHSRHHGLYGHHIGPNAANQVFIEPRAYRIFGYHVALACLQLLRGQRIAHRPPPVAQARMPQQAPQRTGQQPVACHLGRKSRMKQAGSRYIHLVAPRRQRTGNLVDHQRKARIVAACYAIGRNVRS